MRGPIRTIVYVGLRPSINYVLIGQVVEWPVSVLKLAFENFAWLKKPGEAKHKSNFAKTGKWWNGIHAGLKILWPKGCKGSTPFLPARLRPKTCVWGLRLAIENGACCPLII